MSTCIPNDTLGVILAGGLSRRMNGKDKLLLKLNGKTLLSHAIERASPQVEHLILSCNGNLNRFSDYRLEVIADDISPPIGPLAGVISAMQWAQNNAKELKWVMTFAGDTPHFPTNCVTKLKHFAETNELDVAVCSANNKNHYAFALWSVEVLPHLCTSVEQGTRAIHRVIAPLRHNSLSFDGNSSAFFNINTPEDWSIFNQVNHTTEN